MTETSYVCPRTGRALFHNGEALQTHDGSVRYRITRGVPDFRLKPPPDPADERELLELVSLAARDGWRSAVSKLRPLLMPYVDDPSRAMFLDLLPSAPETTALEIGCGLGQILVALAPRVAQVRALELSPGQAQFAAERCQQAGLDNVEVAAGGDDLLLPYADQSFGIVVLNHVFEWAKSPGEEAASLDAQRLLLKEIRRVLKPGGVLFLSTKNRFGLRLLLGGRDENARDIRFGHSLPRPLVSTLSARRKGTLGLLHSYRAIERLLEQAHLQPLRSFWGAPDGRYPKRYIPTDTQSVQHARRDPQFSQGPTRGTRLLMPLVPAPLVKFVAPGLTFLAKAA